MSKRNAVLAAWAVTLSAGLPARVAGAIQEVGEAWIDGASPDGISAIFDKHGVTEEEARLVVDALREFAQRLQAARALSCRLGAGVF